MTAPLELITVPVVIGVGWQTNLMTALIKVSAIAEARHRPIVRARVTVPTDAIDDGSMRLDTFLNLLRSSNTPAVISLETSESARTFGKALPRGYRHVQWSIEILDAEGIEYIVVPAIPRLT